jgi:hypothetical protein
MEDLPVVGKVKKYRDYSQALQLYERWAESRAVADWQKLWLALQEHAAKTVQSQCRGLGIDDERIEAMITDATIYLMEQVQGWPESGKRIDAGWISSRVWFACLNMRQRDYRTIKKLERHDSFEAIQERRHQA